MLKVFIFLTRRHRNINHNFMTLGLFSSQIILKFRINFVFKNQQFYLNFQPHDFPFISINSLVILEMKLEFSYM